VRSKDNTSQEKTKVIKSKKGLRKQRTVELKTDPKFWQQVWMMFENGANALTIAQAYDLPKMSIYRWVKEDPEKEKKVEEYRHMRADGSADSVAQKADRLEEVFDQQITEGKPNPALGNLIFQMRTWDAKVGNPDRYGEKRKIEVTQETRVQHVQELRDLNRRRLKDVMKDITPKKKGLENNEGS
jgi:hypothetical protein